MWTRDARDQAWVEVAYDLTEDDAYARAERTADTARRLGYEDTEYVAVPTGQRP